MEKMIGNTTDILLATVVIEMPATFEDRAITKNSNIKITPINNDIGNQGKESMDLRETSFVLSINPNIVATR